MYRAQLIVIAAALLLSGCEASLTRLPGDRLATQAAPLFPDDPFSSGRLVQPPSWTEVAGNDVPAATESRAMNASAAQGDLLNVDAVNAPLGALLHALATEAGFELQSLGTLDQRVTLKLEQRSLPMLLEALAQQADFVWSLTDDRLEVRHGKAYAFSYPVDYLNMDRRTDSSVGLATQVGTINASDASSHSIANSSQTRLENSSEYRFWDSLQSDIDRLASQQPGDAAPAQYTINREAGLLNLYAVPLVHRSIQRYLEQLHDSAGRQVLIEATVVEVALSDSFEAGVDWQLLARSVNGVSAVQALTGAPLVNAQSLGRVVAPTGMISLVQQGKQADIGATLSLLEQFGDVRILSRPRIIALNNQSSVLKVVDNRVYFTVNIERRQSETRDELVTETEIHTVPVGLVMNVTPQISSSGSVMLNVRPTLSRILGFVNDPNPELAEANVRNGVPEIQIREMESMLQVQSGNMAIIGGLMQETSESSDSGLPALGRVPLFGHLFSQRSRNRRQTELLIVLRPTVITSDTVALASR